MFKKNKTLLIVTTVLILLPIAVGVIFWDRLPDRLPMHWNLSGEVDYDCAKPFGVIFLPILLAVFQWLCTWLESVTKKRRPEQETMPAYVLWIIPVISWLANGMVYAAALNIAIDVTFWLGLFMGLLFVVIGNYMPKCPPSYTLGIKLPWTIKDDENWRKTHRLSGPVWMVCGGVILVASFLKGAFPWVYFVALGTAIIIPTVYSYLLYKRKGE